MGTSDSPGMPTPWRPDVVLRAFLTVFFRELYTRLAWAYDAVAMLTSVGQWFTWQRVAYDALIAGPVLEIGVGTGHVQADLAARGRRPIGIDLSPHMVRISQRRLRTQHMTPMLVRADAGALPFPKAAFACALSTFPSEYMFESSTLHEARRVLGPSGRLVVVPMAQISGSGLADRLAGWLYRVTGQSGPITPGLARVFRSAGFDAQVETIRLPRANVIRISADVAG